MNGVDPPSPVAWKTVPGLAFRPGGPEEDNAE